MTQAAPLTALPARTPLPALLLLLSATTGVVDAVSILGLGRVFTANMTGNVVFLGFAMARAPGFVAEYHLTALLAFVAGAIFAGRAGLFFRQRPLRQWLLFAAIVETGLLWLAALLAGWSGATGTPVGLCLVTLIALTALAMGFRNGTIRQLKVPDLSTTVLTLTITGLAADSSWAGGANPNMSRRVAAIVAIFVGAATGAMLVMRSGPALPLAIAGLLGLAGTVAYARHPSAALPHAG